MQYIHPLWPILYLPDPLQRNLRHTKLPPILLSAICALAARTYDSHKDKLRGSEPNAAQYNSRSLGTLLFNRARYQLIKSNYEPSLATVQALIFMTLRENGSGRAAQGWQYAGVFLDSYVL